MRRNLVPGGLAALCLLALALLGSGGAQAQAAAPPQTVERAALVIGNGAYADSPLRNPVNDARDMARALGELGFTVILRENATKQEMERAIADFGALLSPGAVALFYYAGHGMQVGGRNYLIPVDARIAAERTVRLEAIDVDLVLDQVTAGGSDVNLVILDACRNNPFERRFRGQDGGLAQINAPKGTLIAYATAPGRVAADGEGGNGVYTAKLVDAIRTPGLPVEEVFKRVRAEVSRETGDAQVPWEASSLVGNFYFIGPTTVVVQPPADREALYWEGVKDSADPAQFQSYLDRFPGGAFSELAKLKIAALQRPAPGAPRGLAAYDGIWRGDYACGASPDRNLPEDMRRPWNVSDVEFVVRHGRLTGKRRAVHNRTGKQLIEDFTGTVGEDGTFSLVGKGGYTDNSATYSMQFSGSIGEGRLRGNGRHAARACTLDFFRTAFLAPAPMTTDARALRVAADARRIPLPKDLSIDAPAADLPNELARYLGAWGGDDRWGGRGKQAMLIVEEVKPAGIVRCIYAEGPLRKADGSEEEGAFARVDAVVRDGGIEWTSRRTGTRFRFVLADDADRMQGRLQTSAEANPPNRRVLIELVRIAGTP